MQGCAPRKIDGSPVLWTCEIQCVHHYMIPMKKLRFSSRPRTKVRHHGPPGSARARACMFDMHQSWNSKSSTSILGGGGHTPEIWPLPVLNEWGIWPFLWVGWGIWTASFKLNFFTQSGVWQHSLIDTIFLI